MKYIYYFLRKWLIRLMFGLKKNLTAAGIWINAYPQYLSFPLQWLLQLSIAWFSDLLTLERCSIHQPFHQIPSDSSFHPTAVPCFFGNHALSPSHSSSQLLNIPLRFLPLSPCLIPRRRETCMFVFYVLFAQLLKLLTMFVVMEYS